MIEAFKWLAIGTFIVMFALKLIGFISFSWFFVVLPLLLYSGFWILLLIFGFIGLVMSYNKVTKRK